MLKALEIFGFKSFADKTRFEFPPGITVVVGPNGSGKSNVVDAIRWVLGEQSVKSLRGKEMVDVIFNGSSTRKPLNSAETSLVFDNTDKRLSSDAAEVQITRRVYRSGEGEYLLNRQPCRLRDIRELFAGTGAATEAYGIIEQGKVDILLQAPPRERRVIFEEAAGISRFKAKKIEALRRLERVDQNLLRLSDIVDEVEGRLISVRQQAGKARKYKETADRLQQLRLQAGWSDWRQFTTKLDAIEDETAAIRTEAAAVVAEAEAIEARGLLLETQMAQTDRLVQSLESRRAENRASLAAIESTIEHQRALVRELEAQAARQRRQMILLSLRANDVEGQLGATLEAATAAESRQQQLVASLAEQERTLAELSAELNQLKAEDERRRASLAAETRTAAELSNESTTLRLHLTHAQQSSEQSGQLARQLEARRGALAAEISELNARRQRSTDDLSERAAALADGQKQLADLRRCQTVAQKDLARWQERHTATAERARLLADLERRLEGVSSGVKEALAQAKAEPDGPFGPVRGMLADLLQVDLQTATFIEVALGDKAQHLVLSSDPSLRQSLAQANHPFTGRVGFLNIAKPAMHAAQLTGLPGVVGRADEFVRIAAEHAPLVEHLLGRTWIVENLASALELRGSEAAQGVQFVTLSGQLLESDGTLVVGPVQAASGLISRRSELRALSQQIVEIKQNIEQSERALVELESQLIAAEQQVAELTKEHQGAAEQVAEVRLRFRAASERLVEAEARLAAQTEITAEAERQCGELAVALAISEQSLTQQQSLVAAVEGEIQTAAGRLAGLHDNRESSNRQTQAGRIELARAEQQLDHLRSQLGRHEQDRSERQQAVDEIREQLDQHLARIQQAELSILSAESELALLYLRKETLGGEGATLINRRETLRADRAIATDEAAKRRARLRKLDDKLHKRELAASQFEHERTTLVDRLREDYGIELGTQDRQSGEVATPTGEYGLPQSPSVKLFVPPTEPPADDRPRVEIEAEIADLRGKLAALGNVNLDSLDEADELERRFAGISAQFQDLTQAKASLVQIVTQINADSRRLFAETLETIKEHFQTLFRKLFGGGQVDIVLEEGIDILDGGVEIIARPPGKEPRNISLLSGGERTLTCLALLLAIFRTRPSPFCVLDEVDSALDEANIDRFVTLLQEFLIYTQFIIVTHSKKTMTVASTLYGVTMQESGVSKRVSVQFDDVSENGDILPTAASRNSGTGPASDSARAA
jgi:chromosome segregation protein